MAYIHRLYVILRKILGIIRNIVYNIRHREYVRNESKKALKSKKEIGVKKGRKQVERGKPHASLPHQKEDI